MNNVNSTAVIMNGQSHARNSLRSCHAGLNHKAVVGSSHTYAHARITHKSSEIDKAVFTAPITVLCTHTLY